MLGNKTDANSSPLAGEGWGKGQAKPITKAWVIFSPQADMKYLKILKRGYRHCAILLNDGKHWITVDPLSNYTDINVHDVPLEFNLPLWMRDQGYTITTAPIQRTNTPAPWGIFSCVESVKRVLGIHKRRIITPWQLYKYLQKSTLNQ